MVKNQFHFKEIEPHSELENFAQLKLSEIRKLAPFGSTAVALLEKAQEGYWCSIDIYSRTGPIMAKSFDSDAKSAIEGMVTKIKERIKEQQQIQSQKQIKAQSHLI